jgi:hypothetical protein
LTKNKKESKLFISPCPHEGVLIAIRRKYEEI